MNTATDIGGWRHPVARRGLHDFALYKDLALRAEAAKFDAIFFADSAGLYPIRGRRAFANSDLAKIEPITMQSAIAARANRIGLVTTYSTTHSPPFTLARQFASLNHRSKGPAPWNIVSLANEPRGEQLRDRSRRDRARTVGHFRG